MNIRCFPYLNYFSLATLMWSSLVFGSGTTLTTAELIELYAETIYRESGAIGMGMVVINNDKTYYQTWGETSPGSNRRPTRDSLIRIASITKLMTSEILVKLDHEGKLKLTDPLYKYIPNGIKFKRNTAFASIRLYQLAAHTSGLPREQPGRPARTPVFTWPLKKQRWAWLQRGKINYTPGTRAAYSNLAYDLLADALAQAAGQPYPVLFKEKITTPLAMNDTTYTPTAAQCARLMVGFNAGSCTSSLAAIGSGGVYSTLRDMQKWMAKFIQQHQPPRAALINKKLKMYYQRQQLTSLIGMDVAGRIDRLGLGWVDMPATEGQLTILQKTGGAGGFITYLAIVPDQQLGIFVVVTRSTQTRFKNMSNGANELLARLAQQPESAANYSNYQRKRVPAGRSRK